MNQQEEQDLSAIWRGLDHALNRRNVQEAKGYAADLRFFIENGRIPKESETDR